MPRYIDADAFVMEQCNSCDGACEAIPCDCLNCNSDCRCDMIKDLLDAPTISTDEVRGVGKWLDTPYAIECSKCHEEFDSDVACCDIYGWPWKFCPKCGARMTEVSEDE